MAAICGTHRGLTNDPTTIWRRPVADSASSSSILAATLMPALSICMPSRMPSSMISTLGRAGKVMSGPPWSVRLGQAERAVRDLREHDVVADRGDCGQPCLAEPPLDAVLLGHAVAAEGVHGRVGGGPQRLRGKQLAGVHLEGRVLALLEQLGGLPSHQARGLQVRVRLGERELDALVLADWPAEDLTLVGVGGRAVDEVEAGADVLRRDEYPLGVHPGQDVAEALALLPDQVLRRHPQVADGQLVGLVVD